MNQLPRLIRRVVAAPKFSPTDWNVLARSFIQPIDAPNNLPRTKLKTFAEISNEGPAQTLPCSCQLQILSCNLTWTYVRHNYNRMEILLIYSRVERQRGCNLHIYITELRWTWILLSLRFLNSESIIRQNIGILSATHDEVSDEQGVDLK